MTKLPLITGSELIKLLEKEGFNIVRQRGSHVRMRHRDGRVTTIPIHKGQVIHRGLLRKILRDCDLSIGDFLKLLGK
jgi:predicted RNA binding protein YcfA (HicA-like mRNA interferase family)